MALKPRGDVTRSPKQGYQWPHKKRMSSKIFLKKLGKFREQNFGGNLNNANKTPTK